jgi:hypothetical protein
MKTVFGIRLPQLRQQISQNRPRITSHSVGGLKHWSMEYQRASHWSRVLAADTKILLTLGIPIFMEYACEFQN